jgi:polyhydroxyalkanoate synthase subunit PhaC
LSSSSQYPSPLDESALDQLRRVVDKLREAMEFIFRDQDRAAEPVDGSNSADAPGIRGKSFFETIQAILALALAQPESLARHYGDFAAMALRALSGETVLQPVDRDRRFKDPMWRSDPFYRGMLQLYLAWTHSMQSWLDEQQLSEAERARVQFIVDQLISTLAPSNLPLHPAALKRAETTHGDSFVVGVRQWIDDVLHNNAMPRQILPGAYTLGRDLACTPGAVVFRNRQLELIQYRPTTSQVHRRPVLIVPAQINKYYCFDLRPSNSMIRYLVEQGFQVFAISWFNPTKAERAWGMNEYIAAALEAMDALAGITGCRTLNIMSACAGGLTAMVLLGYLAERKRNVIHSHSLLVTALLSNYDSLLERFATVEGFRQAKAWSKWNGVMEGKDLFKIFAMLRPNDLVWNYWVNNYLLGRKPHALDVLYWDNDSTRLPAKLHADFLDMYAKEVFEHPGAMKVLGARVDFRKICVNTYFTAGEDDYLTPWHSVYRSAKFFRGNHEFVVSDSGHVQSLLRPPNIARTQYYTNTGLPELPQEWMDTATRHEGSWWPHWVEWLRRQSGSMKAAPLRLGSKTYPELMAAPGSYVFRRSER